MSARERVEARCVMPGWWQVEGWEVTRHTRGHRVRWFASATYGDTLYRLEGPTLESICGQIIDFVPNA